MNGVGRQLLNYSQRGEEEKVHVGTNSAPNPQLSQCITRWRASEQKGRDTEGPETAVTIWNVKEN